MTHAAAHALTPPPDLSADADARTGEADALAALIGSRICHDLVNPVGAIANGVELLQMGGAEPGGPELQLVADSVAQTAARLKFFRIAYGVASPAQMLGRTETELILTDAYSGGRLKVLWSVDADCPRAETKLAFLLLQCAEAAMPRGGEIEVWTAEGRWRIEARAPRLAVDPALWSLLEGAPLPEALKPGEVQFALAPRAAAAVGRRIDAAPGPDVLRLQF
jgi:histidine phosphotransferase ChpT